MKIFRNVLYSVSSLDKSADLTDYILKVKGLVANGFFDETLKLFQKLHCSSVIGNDFILPSILKACSALQALQLGRQIHCQVIKMGHEFDTITQNSLLTMYAKCSDVEAASLMFNAMSKGDIVSWNAMISCHTRNGNCTKALQLFKLMEGSDMEPNRATMCSLVAGFAQNSYGAEALDIFKRFQAYYGLKPTSGIMVSLLLVSAQIGFLELGREIHAYSIRHELDTSLSLETALMDMYSKCCNLRSAYELFKRMRERNEVSWTVMISGFARNGDPALSLDLLRLLQVEGMKPNRVTLITALPACAELRAVKQGKEIHGFAIRHCYASDPRVTGALIDMYSCFGAVDLADLVFKGVEQERDVVLWSSIIYGCSNNGRSLDALDLFSQMRMSGTRPNSVTLLGVLSACTSLSAMQLGQAVHGYSEKTGLVSAVFVRNSLISFYSKCGSIEAARGVFDGILERDCRSWSSMITGYGLNGQGKEALQVFNEMLNLGFKPDLIVFLSALSACRHCGLVREGCEIFDSMTKVYEIDPGPEHYACLVDLLGRSGRLEEACGIVKNMKVKPSPSVWSSLVFACRTHGRVEMAEKLLDQLIESEPENPANYAMLSNVYVDGGKWDGAERLRRMMRERGLKKYPGFSWVGIGIDR
ncbi:pentatricopeptide repeat-containing protein At4g31070, mitochondrial isoform X1 [Amborella trichopoda]|uniref:pentatricopeptide repeat-containing protein At4g31070, mitochondrial isoform X1 n=2 Tax=Amborella trichopoda TaxID=13333 RepID=UPI0009BDF35D|nr:pentatricopeptide repeat-containing protein At4g31070, mitochondrial isoform X1 [Amborella trichopoda]|eukprot:XP_020527106.1 pentatricopeptide repeat-containing protein At4g31070, mitochondrial isoform X1 [Amborella trichopoda]